MFYVYILRTSSNTLYIGQTNNLQKRLKEHQNKSSKSAKYIRYFSSFDLVYSERYPTRKEAMQREVQTKTWDEFSRQHINLYNTLTLNHRPKEFKSWSNLTEKMWRKLKNE
ncbi:GIY-YIG nuclease family protein [Candidatus Woesebacteria bacterium]|nr:GIY-YIG nuclease family protein [Candidatus Woesebacteria bacterium]